MRVTLGSPAKRGSRGSAIMEALMTSAIVGTMGGGLIGTFTYGFMAMQMVRENQRATQIILEKVETLRLYSWDQVMAPGFIPPTFTAVFDPQADEDGMTYSGSVEITEPSSGSAYGGNLRELVVTVTWTSVNKAQRTRTLATYIAKDGLQNYVY